MTLSPIEKLRFDHNTESFDVSSRNLIVFSINLPLLINEQISRKLMCFVVVKLLLLTTALPLATPITRTRRIVEGAGHYPVQLMILARLAVIESEQGKGIGSALLKDALRRTAQAADIAGIRALFVHAKDENARAFYEWFDFKPSSMDHYHLVLLMKDILRFFR